MEWFNTALLSLMHFILCSSIAFLWCCVHSSHAAPIRRVRSYFGITGLVNDDSINNAELKYQIDEEKATRELIMKGSDKIPLRSLAYLIGPVGNSLSISHQQHIKMAQKLDHKPMHCDAFCTIRRQLLFISKSYFPDIAYNVWQLCQVK